ncbi:hypothetical protein GCM10011594_24120 [Nakamurella endophytica]|uniref:Uncharacterized protein n=1 Tax=Nakamurella endophytica TaxID=1748367 RepID=A0A917SXX0_9ACTN|nr:hypothetical protein GCM10011594_24120 [Nakamurella endophytica]
MPSTGDSTDTSTPDTTADTSSTDSTETTDSSSTGSTESTGSTGSTGSSTSSSDTSTSTSGSSGSGTGSYATTPRSIPERPSAAGATLLESQRLAGAVVPPTLIDPRFTKLASLSTLPFKSPAAITQILVSPADSVAARAGMLAGFASSRSTTDGSASMVVALFEFDTPAAATAGAKALVGAAQDKKGDTGKAAVPGFAGAAGWTGRSTTSSGTRAYLHAFLPQGSLVLYVWTQGPTSAASSLPALARSAFTVEVAAAKAFKPLRKSQLADQQVDPDGLLARTVPNVGEDLTVVDGLYSGAGELNYDTDPVGTRKLFDATGVDRVSLGRVNVYRARDAAGARAVRDSFIAQSVAQAQAQGQDPWEDFDYTGPVPGTRCLQQTLNSVFYCMSTRDRYAMEVSASSESDLEAALAAQYDLLGTF